MIEITAKDNQNLTALEYACRDEYDSTAALLIDRTEPMKLVEAKYCQNLPVHYLTRCSTEKCELFTQMLDRVKEYSVSVMETLMLHRVDENKHTILEIAMDHR